MVRNLPSVTSPPWSKPTKTIITLILLGVILVVLGRISRSAWSSIVLAVLLAYLLSPVVTFFERRLGMIRFYDLRRTLAVVLTWLVVGGAMWILGGLIIPSMVDQSKAFADDLPAIIDDTQKDIEEFLNKPIRVGSFTLVPMDELEKAFDQGDGEQTGGINTALQDMVVSLAYPALDVLGGAVSFLFTAAMVLVLSFYLMRDGPVFVEYLVGTVPESYRGDVLRLLREIGRIWNAYLRGQLMLCTAVGVATYIAALILGLPQPLVLALIAGLFELVPNFGPILASVPALLFALTTPSTTLPGLDAGLFYALVVALVYTGIQQIEAIFLVPRILGGSLDLHPFVVLVSLIIGASLVGVLGLLLAAPTVATLRLLARYLRGKLLDEEVFPPVPTIASQPRGSIYSLLRFFLSKRFPVKPEEELVDRQPLTATLFTESINGGRLSEYPDWGG